MIPIKQNRVHPKIGNCAAAALASILEIPLTETFDGDPENCTCHDDGKFWETMRAWLLRRNLMWAVIGHAPYGYSVAIGPSPRLRREDGKIIPHACVAFDGDLVHDPHPDGTFFGGEEPYEFWILYMPDPSKCLSKS